MAPILTNPLERVYTANLYRDLWGFCREMGVQGSQIYRVSLGMKSPVNVTVVSQKNTQEMLVMCLIYRKIPVTQKKINKTLKLDDYMEL